MILFPPQTHKAIKSGHITLAFRLWKSCPLVKGNTYNLGRLGAILVKAADKISLSAISEDEARQAGFTNTKALITQLKSQKPNLNPQNDSCFRIEFTFLGDSPPIKQPSGRQDRRLWRNSSSHPLSPHILDRLDERLKRLDRRAQGITYSAILKELSRRKFEKIASLAEHFLCQFTEIRRKLYRLMNERLVIGDAARRYSLTPRGRQLISHREAKLAELQKP